MFKMGCTMGRKILGKGSSSSATADAGATSSSSSAFADSNSTNKKSNKEGAAGGGGATTTATKQEELNDFSKLEEDPRLPLNVRQIFKITKSWKAIARTMSKTGTAMFLNLFEQNQDLFYLFERFQHLKGKDLHESMELREHAATVMSTLDQSINSLSDYDNFIIYLHSIGKLHRKVPGFKREHFWKIEQPFLKAVKQTLDERCNETIEEIYRIAIKLILETIAEGYGEDRPDVEGSASGAGGLGGLGGLGGGGNGSATGGPANEQNGNNNGGGGGVSGDKSSGYKGGQSENNNRGNGGSNNNNNNMNADTTMTAMNAKGNGTNGRTKQQTTSSDWAKLQLLLLKANKMNTSGPVDVERPQSVATIASQSGERNNSNNENINCAIVPILCSTSTFEQTTHTSNNSKQQESSSGCPLMQMRNNDKLEDKQREIFSHSDESIKTNKKEDSRNNDKIHFDRNNDQAEQQQQQQQQQEIEKEEDRLKSTIICLKELLLLAVKGVSEQPRQPKKQIDVAVCESSNGVAEFDDEETKKKKRNQSEEEEEGKEESGDDGNGRVKIPPRDLQQQQQQADIADEWAQEKEVALIGCCINANNNNNSNNNNNNKLNAYTDAANGGRGTKEEMGRGRTRTRRGGRGRGQVCMFKRALLFVGLDRLFMIRRQRERNAPMMPNIKGCSSSVESLSANGGDRERETKMASIELEKTRRCQCKNEGTNIGDKGQFNDNYNAGGYANCEQQQQQQQQQKQDASQGNRGEVHLIERGDSSRLLPSDVIAGDERKETSAMNRDHNKKGDNFSESSSCKAAATTTAAAVAVAAVAVAVGADLCQTGSSVSTEVPVGAASKNIINSFYLDSLYHRELLSHNSVDASSYYVKGTTITYNDVSCSSSSRSSSQNGTGQRQQAMEALKTGEQEQTSRSIGVDDNDDDDDYYGDSDGVGDKRSSEMSPATANNEKISSNSPTSTTTLRPPYSIIDKRNGGADCSCPLELPDDLHYSPSLGNETNSYHQSGQQNQQLDAMELSNDGVAVVCGQQNRQATATAALTTNTKTGVIDSSSIELPADMHSNSKLDHHNNDWNNNLDLNKYNHNANGHENTTNISKVKASSSERASTEQSHCGGGGGQNQIGNNYLSSCSPHPTELKSRRIKQSSSSSAPSSSSSAASAVTKCRIGRRMVRMLLSRAHKLDRIVKTSGAGNNESFSSDPGGNVVVVDAAAAASEMAAGMRQAKVNGNRDLVLQVSGSRECNHQKLPLSLGTKTMADGEDSRRHQQSQFAMSGHHDCNCNRHRHHKNQKDQHEDSCSNCLIPQTSTIMTTPSTTTTTITTPTTRPTTPRRGREKEENKQNRIESTSEMMSQAKRSPPIARLTNNPVDLSELIKMLMFTLLHTSNSNSNSNTNSSVSAQRAN